MNNCRSQFGKLATLAEALVFASAATVAGQQGIVSSGSASQASIVREIDDPSSGTRWLLVPGYPGGPGRFVIASGPVGQAARTEIHPPSAPILRAGDRILLEEHSAVVDARLEAVALGAAALGGPLNVRLQVGGRIVRALAVGPGRAIFAPSQEDRP